MASRIITKKGSGAPLASDLVHGELAVDTVNKRLYTENAGGTVVELGTAPSTIDINGGTIDDTVIGGTTAAAGSFTTGQFDTSVNVDGTVTADGLTIGESPADSTTANVTATFIAPSDQSAELWIGSNDLAVSNEYIGGLGFYNSDNTAPNLACLAGIKAFAQSSNGEMGLRFYGGRDKFDANTPNMEIDASGDISFYEDTGTTAKLFWDASAERLGIGTSSPAAKLDVSGAIKVSQSGSAVLTVDRQSTLANQIALQNNGVTNGLIGASSSALASFADGAGAERVRIDSSGNLLVGTTTQDSGAKFTLDDQGVVGLSLVETGTISHGRIYFKNGNGVVGQIVTDGSTTSYTNLSDERLKENITDAPAGNVDDIKVRSFDWKVDGSHQDYGMVAQELEAVAPYAVTKGETENDMWSVDYSKLVPMLIKEIQDLKAEVAALKGAN